MERELWRTQRRWSLWSRRSVYRNLSRLFAACLFALLFGGVWSITGRECLPGGNLFGIIILFICSVLGGKLVGMIQLPTLPPFPPLLGMLLAGLLLRNVPYITTAVFIDTRWSAALRNIALSVILTRAGLGLDPSALQRLKAVFVRVAVGPCTVEASVVAVVSHFLLGLPWTWAFILGFVLSAVSPAVVVPSMLLLQREGLGVEKGIPTLLMAAGSFDGILAITGFSTCLGIAFSTGSTWMTVLQGLLEVVGGVISGLVVGFFLCLFPSNDQEDLVLGRTLMLLGLSVFSVFFSHVVGFSGAGGLCTLVHSFCAALGWKSEKAPVAAMVGRSWDLFQPLLFGLIGAEITISTLSPSTVGRHRLQGVGHGEGGGGRDYDQVWFGRADLGGVGHLDHRPHRCPRYRTGRTTPPGPSHQRRGRRGSRTFWSHRTRPREGQQDLGEQAVKLHGGAAALLSRHDAAFG
uniref:Cation/H+ exchanger domain-containing protein n=1 Tax=Oryzias latipes TaxID=8090 RepID=A0A3P9I5R9_ORYLA